MAEPDVSRRRADGHRSNICSNTTASRVLVDCGLFQGLKSLRDAQLGGLSRPAGLDHRGRPHPCAPGSRRLPSASASRRDSADGLSARPARRISAGWCCRIRDASRKRTRGRRTSTATRGMRRRCRCTTRVAAQRALTHLQPVGYEREIEVAPGISADSIHAGHLLGSAFVRVRLHGSTDHAVRRRPRPLRPSRAAGSADAARGRRSARGIDIWRSRPPGRRSRRGARRDHSGQCRSAAAS